MKNNNFILREIRQRYIKAKYEHHMFVKNESSIVIVKDFFEFVRKNDSYKVLELLLYLFSQNVDLFTPLSDDVKNIHILALCRVSYV